MFSCRALPAADQCYLNFSAVRQAKLLICVTETAKSHDAESYLIQINPIWTDRPALLSWIVLSVFTGIHISLPHTCRTWHRGAVVTFSELMRLHVECLDILLPVLMLEVVTVSLLWLCKASPLHQAAVDHVHTEPGDPVCSWHCYRYMGVGLCYYWLVINLWSCDKSIPRVGSGSGIAL